MQTQLPCGRLEYRSAGRGRDLVLLHGLLGCGAQWDGVTEVWRERYTCWMPELPGISASEKLRDSSLTGLRQWLEQASVALDWRDVTMVASSWAGAVALQFAADSPERGRLHSLVLVAPVHPDWTPSRRQRVLLTPVVARIGAWLGARASARVHRRMLATSYGDARRMTGANVAQYGATFRRRGLGAAVAAFGRHLHRDLLALALRLRQVSMPVVLVWGSEDIVVPVTTAPALAGKLPHASMIVLPGLGHLPFIEDPVAFSAAVGLRLD